MKRIHSISIVIITLMICLLFTSCAGITDEIDVTTSDELIVHYIDVGQGDSILIQFPEDKVALIDGGTREAGDKVVSYIESLGLKRIDYLIATHPHEDHIGGLPAVIRNFEIGKVFMPNKTANTKIFEELLNEIENKGLKITIVKGFETIFNDNNLEFVTLGPLKDSYSNTNDYSIVTRIEYANNSFLFTGDIEAEAELDLIEEDFNLKSDVLKVAHHGSSTSSTVEFLEEVAPNYAVVSLGKDNPYGHPHKEVLERLNSIGTKILRTDELGDIVIISDGNNITVENINEKGQDSIEDTLYIGNRNTKTVHSEDCSSLPNKENQVIFYSLDKAIKKVLSLILDALNRRDIMKGIVDRFEGSKVVVEMEDGKKMETFDRKLFPDSLKEGDVVIFKDDRFVVDELETEKRKAYMENLFKRLTDKGMD